MSHYILILILSICIDFRHKSPVSEADFTKEIRTRRGQPIPYDAI